MITTNDLIRVFKLQNPKLIKDNLMSSCPFADVNHKEGKDTHRSFGINMDTLQWNCFSCQERGENIRSLAYRLQIQLSPDMMMDTLLDLDDITKNKKEGIIGNYDFSLVKSAVDNWSGAMNYLGKRGISEETVRRFHVGKNESTQSIVFPCIDHKGHLNGWVERNELWDNRYGFRPYQVARDHLLFGLDREFNKIILVESSTDMLLLNSWGYDAVSTCGNKIFSEQARRLLSCVDEITILPQNDQPAIAWIKDYSKELRGKLRSFIVNIPPEYKDVCTNGYTREEFKIVYENRSLLL